MYRRNGTVNFQALSVCETQGSPAFSFDYVLSFTSFSQFLGSYINTQVPPVFSPTHRSIIHTQAESLRLGESWLLKLKSMIAALVFIYRRRPTDNSSPEPKRRHRTPDQTLIHLSPQVAVRQRTTNCNSRITTTKARRVVVVNNKKTHALPSKQHNSSSYNSNNPTLQVDVSRLYANLGSLTALRRRVRRTAV